MIYLKDARKEGTVGTSPQRVAWCICAQYVAGGWDCFGVAL